MYRIERRVSSGGGREMASVKLSPNAIILEDGRAETGGPIARRNSSPTIEDNPRAARHYGRANGSERPTPR